MVGQRQMKGDSTTSHACFYACMCPCVCALQPSTRLTAHIYFVDNAFEKGCQCNYKCVKNASLRDLHMSLVAFERLFAVT